MALSGTGEPRQRFQAAAARGLTRLGGRDTELTVLEEALRRAGAGHGQVVVAVGEASVGQAAPLSERLPRCQEPNTPYPVRTLW